MAKLSSPLSTLFYPQHMAKATVPAAAQASRIPRTQPRRRYQSRFSLASPLRSPKDIFISQEINRAPWPWAATLFILSAGEAGVRPAAWISFTHSVLKRHISKKHPVINHSCCQAQYLERKNPKLTLTFCALWCLRTCVQNTHWQTSKKQPCNTYITTWMHYNCINWKKDAALISQNTLFLSVILLDLRGTR